MSKHTDATPEEHNGYFECAHCGYVATYNNDLMDNIYKNKTRATYCANRHIAEVIFKKHKIKYCYERPTTTDKKEG